MLFQRLKRSCAAAAVMVLAMAATPPGNAAAPDPAAGVEEFNATLLDVMKKAKELGYAGRRDMLSPKLAGLFHLPVMARIAVGAYWQALSPDQQTALTDAFARMTIATYANRFDGWNGERFEMRGVDSVRDKTVLVKTALIRPNDDPVEINYLMREFAGGWHVIDVYLKQAYSELATRRSEYSSILARQGYDGLLREIEAKIAQYAGSAG